MSIIRGRILFVQRRFGSSLHQQWVNLWGPALWFGVMTVVMTWPLVTQINRSVIGPADGDNWYFIWLFGWFQKSLIQLGHNPLFVPFHNYPYGWSLAYTEISLANVLPALPISWLGGPALAYNLILLLSFILSGLIVFWWVKSLTGNGFAGLVAGSLFAFAPYRLAHIYGHLQLMGTQYLALHFYGLHHLLRKRSVSWKYAALAGLGLGLAGLSSMYYLYMTLIVSGLYVLGYVWIFEHGALRRKVWWQNLLALALVALPFLLAAVAPYLQLSAQGVANQRPLSEVDLWSASPMDFLLPAPVHFAWGQWILHTFERSDWIEQTIYLGAVTILLCLVALAWPRKKPELGKTSQLLVFAAAGAGVLALGTTLHWNRQQILIDLPRFFWRHWILLRQTPIYLPNDVLFQYLPFYNNMRIWMRYGIYVNLFTAVLAGVGYAYFVKVFNRRLFAYGILALTLALIGLDFYSGPYPLIGIQPRPVDRWLATQPDDGAVVQLPIRLSTEPNVLYGTLFYKQPFIGMFYGGYLPRNFERIIPPLDNFPNKISLKILRDRGVKYILVDASAYPDWEEMREQIESFGLAERIELDGQFVFEFSSPPRAVP